MKKIDPNEIFEYLTHCPEGTKIYLGADSERFRIKGEWFCDVISVCVVHIGGNSGCKIFGQVDRQRDYDRNKARPVMRMMAEVYALADLFTTLKDVIEASGFDFELHIDINPDETAGSSCAIDQAIGYIRGTCNVTPLAKPSAFAASYASDRYKEVQSFKTIKGFEKLSYKRKKAVARK